MAAIGQHLTKAQPVGEWVEGEGGKLWVNIRRGWKNGEALRDDALACTYCSNPKLFFPIPGIYPLQN